DGRADARRRRVGEHLQPIRSRLPVWRVQGVGLRTRGRAARPAALPGAGVMPTAKNKTNGRIDVRKTYKLFIAGEFVRSESGRAYRFDDNVNVPRGSRKDLRDAVRAARGGVAGWSARTAMNRGQILYRAAEMLDGRRAQFVELLVSARAAHKEVDEAVEALVWYAGWTDKLAQVIGGTNPVSGPYFNFTIPEPTGV